MSEDPKGSKGKEAASAHSSSTRKTTPAPYEPINLYFRPDTEELIYVPGDEAASFEAEWRGMGQCANNVAIATQALNDTTELLSKAKSDAETRQIAQKISAAEQDLAKYKKELSDKVSDKTAFKYKDVVELIPIARPTIKTGKQAGKPAGKDKQLLVGKTYVYVRDEKLKTTKIKKQKLSSVETKSGQESIFKTDKKNRRQIDTNKLTEQLAKLTKKGSAKWTIYDGLSEAEKEKLQKKLNGTLFEWAEKCNEALAYQKKLGDDDGPGLDLSAGAQLMRYTANASAAGEWNPKEGSASLTAEGHAQFALLEGQASAVTYLPNRKGWVWSFDGVDPKGRPLQYPMGAFRFDLTLELIGMVGASVLVEGAVEAVLVTDKKTGKKRNAVVGAKGKRTTFAQSQTGMLVNKGEPAIGVSADAEAFAGASACGKLTGTLKWLTPEKPQKGFADPDFEDLCEVGPGFTAMAGAGAGLKFYCIYQDTRFRFGFAASLCWGVGAKGSLEMTVNIKQMTNFVIWVGHQLYHANYYYLQTIEKTSFQVLTQIIVMAISGAEEIAKFMLDTTAFINESFKLFCRDMEKSKRRNQLASNILSSQGDTLLLHATPEAKGVLLYQLSRHTKADWIDPGNYATLDAFHDRKLAIIKVLKTIQTLREWNLIMCRITEDGHKLDGSHELTLHRVLDLGADMSWQMDAIKYRLKTAPAYGYAMTWNDTPAYDLYRCDNPHYAQGCEQIALNTPPDIDSMGISNSTTQVA